MKNLTTVFLLTLSAFYTFGQEKILSFEAYCQSLKSGEAIEYLEISWPGDDLLCDDYEESDGELIYCVYRLSSSKKIVMVTESGNYCQGDSDYYYMYLMAENGFAVYSVDWDYNGTSLQFYDAGIPIVKVAYPGEVPSEDYYPKISKLNAAKANPITSEEFELKIEEYREIMRKRISALKNLHFGSNETAKKAEAQNLINQLENTLAGGIEYKTGEFTFRKPEGALEEMARLNNTEIRVRKEPNSSAGIISKVSYYDGSVEVVEKGKAETIEPWGNHPWYKISYTDDKTDQTKEGWIFGAFIAEGIFPTH